MKIDAPTTPVPNHIIDRMADMKPSVFAVCMVVVRQTYGYVDRSGDSNAERREWDEISTSQFMEKTGLSNRAVIDAIKTAIKDGYIQRKQMGQSYSYRVAVAGATNQDNIPTYEDSSQVAYEDSSQVDKPTYEDSSQEPMKIVHTQNKRNKNTLRAADAGPPTSDTRTEQQQWFGAVCDIIGWDYKTLDKAQSGQVAQTVGILRKAGYTLEDLTLFWAEVWEKDWRWKDNKSRPTIKQLRAEVGKVRDAPGHSSNGTTPRTAVLDTSKIVRTTYS